MSILDTLRSNAAALTDALAALGERMPGVSSLTVTAAGVTVTVVPQAPVRPPVPDPTCASCGRPK